MADEFSVEAKGDDIADITRAITEAVPRLREQLADIDNKLVDDAVSDARSNFYRTVPGRKRSTSPSGTGSVGRSIASIRAVRGEKESKITAGGLSAPGFFGHEFGGGGRKTTRQFPAFKGQTGYALYPAIRRRRDKAEPEWEELLEDFGGES
jgi:hypothetical protein